jgi:hypothetical protein
LQANYTGLHSGGYRYSRFCEAYRDWPWRISVTMRQRHAAGDTPLLALAPQVLPSRGDFDRWIQTLAERVITPATRCRFSAFYYSAVSRSVTCPFMEI